MTEEQDKLIETNHRLTRLETRFDAIIPFLATKLDLEETRLHLTAAITQAVAESEQRLLHEFTALHDQMNRMGDRLEQVADRTHDEMMRLMRWGTGVCIAMALAIGGVYATVLFR